MGLGFTYPRTSSDGDKPVTLFKETLEKVLRQMADKEVARATNPLKLQRDIRDSLVRADTYLTIADMCRDIIIEGESA